MLFRLLGMILLATPWNPAEMGKYTFDVIREYIANGISHVQLLFTLDLTVNHSGCLSLVTDNHDLRTRLCDLP